MYQPKFHQLTFENFHLPFGGKLDPENRWVKLAAVIPWHVAETMYAKNFLSKRGAPALTVRMALGSLIIKEKLGLSDIETRRTDQGEPVSPVLHRACRVPACRALRCFDYPNDIVREWCMM